MTKEQLIERAKVAFAAYRGLGRNIIDELIFALTVANKEVCRLTDSHAELLAAAKGAAGVMSGILNSHAVNHGMVEDCCMRLTAAIAKAEEVAS